MAKTFVNVFLTFAVYLSAVVVLKLPIGVEYESMWIVPALLAMFFGVMLQDSLGVLVGGVVLAIVIGVKIATSTVFMSGSYVDLVQAEDANLTAFNTKEEDTRRVTLPMALQVANKVLGTKHEGNQISSQYKIEKTSASVQEVDGELVWILPLDYQSFFKWLNLESIPGYIKLSATDPKARPELVLDKEIKVSKGGWFGDSISRKVWWGSGMKQTDTHLEVDDNGNPYYISVVEKPEIGFNADGVEEVVVTNAKTGEMDTVSLEDVNQKYPWIDRIWPEDIIEERIEWYGSLQNGWLNSVFAQKNVSVPTSYSGQELWMVKANGKLNWFTGMTSASSSDASLVSGTFVEASATSSKPVIHVFDMNMVSDESGAVQAMDSALGADSVRWSPVLPQPYIVEGRFYWTAVIASGSNIFQKKAYMQGDDISNVSFDSLRVSNPSVGGDFKAADTKESVMLEILQKVKELDALRARYESM